jgi:hypothetical protein
VIVKSASRTPRVLAVTDKSRSSCNIVDAQPASVKVKVAIAATAKIFFIK